VGPHVSKPVTVIFKFIPKSIQCPAQSENIICCHTELPGTLIESVVPAVDKIVPFAQASIHL